MTRTVIRLLSIVAVVPVTIGICLLLPDCMAFLVGLLTGHVAMKIADYIIARWDVKP